MGHAGSPSRNGVILSAERVPKCRGADAPCMPCCLELQACIPVAVAKHDGQLLTYRQIGRFSFVFLVYPQLGGDFRFASFRKTKQNNLATNPPNWSGFFVL